MERVNKVEVQLEDMQGTPSIRFIFPKKLSRLATEECIEAWGNLLKQHQLYRYNITWDCSVMTDYEPMARVLMQKAIMQRSKGIGVVYLISQNSIIRSGARLMNMFVSFKIVTLTHNQELLTAA